MANSSRKGPQKGNSRAYIANGAVTKYAAVTGSTDSADGDPRCALPGGAGVYCLGVAQNDADSGDVVTVAYDGESYVSANGAFAIGEALSIAATDGQVDTATNLQFLVGLALDEATAANDLVVVKLTIGAQCSI
jgi:predicted RecA/RadA family phage recombinase